MINSRLLQDPASLRRKKESRRGINYTILLVGGESTGKTTFANNLMECNVLPHRYSDHSSNLNNNILNSNVKLIKPTQLISFTAKDGIPSLINEFNPSIASIEPGITITSTSLEISSNPLSNNSDEDILLFNIIDVHGIGENLDNSNAFTEITSYLEQQFETVLAEETRVKRNPRFEDTRVHVALYFIEATGHGLKDFDVEMMKKLSRYTNVLPIISKADSFTPQELLQFKKNILFDIDRYNVPIFKFDLENNQDQYLEEDDYETLEENRHLAEIQPFSIICSDEKDSQGNYIRQYPWGTIYINDNDLETSDLNILKNVLFGSHLQEFKDNTQNFLYENYRAEKLLAVTNDSTNGYAESSTNPLNSNDKALKRQSAAPSLSNFASLVNTGKFKSSNDLSMTMNEEFSNDQNVSNETPQATPKISQDSEINENINPNTIASSPERIKLRNISETIPYVLRHERILVKQQKLQELEAKSAKELQLKIMQLEKKAHDLKLREKLLLKQKLNNMNDSTSSFATASTTNTPSTTAHSFIKKEETLTDLSSIVSARD